MKYGNTRLSMLNIEYMIHRKIASHFEKITQK